MEKYAYTLYGKPAAASTVGNPYMYTGRRLDPETGLYYYRARYYDPHLRRFIETDPIGYAGGMNLYAYVGNSPVNFVDPWGLDEVIIYYWHEDSSNFEAAAISKKKELEAAGHNVRVQSYDSRVKPTADIVYFYSHGNPSGPNAYGFSAADLNTLGLMRDLDEYRDFSNVKKEAHFMGCNIGHDFYPNRPGNQSFAQYLAEFRTDLKVFASTTGTDITTSSPTGKYNAEQRNSLLNGPGWKSAIESGDLRVNYKPNGGGNYTAY